MNANLFRSGNPVAILLALVFQVRAHLGSMLAEKIGVLVFVAGGDQLFKLQFLEVVREVVKELADLGVVAVTQDGFVFEVFRVVPHLLLDVGELGIKLILLRRLGGV